jgi:hypothetical protein
MMKTPDLAPLRWGFFLHSRASFFSAKNSSLVEGWGVFWKGNPMTSRWLLPLSATAIAFIFLNPAIAAQEQSCVTVDQKSQNGTVDAVMAALGGAGSVAVLIGGGRVRMLIKAAAVSGVMSSVWSAAKALGVDNTITICTPKTATEPATVVMGRPWQADQKPFDHLSTREGGLKWSEIPPATITDLDRIDWSKVREAMGNLDAGVAAPPTGIGGVRASAKPPAPETPTINLWDPSTDVIEPLPPSWVRPLPGPRTPLR